MKLRVLGLSWAALDNVVVKLARQCLHVCLHMENPKVVSEKQISGTLKASTGSFTSTGAEPVESIQIREVGILHTAAGCGSFLH